MKIVNEDNYPNKTSVLIELIRADERVRFALEVVPFQFSDKELIKDMYKMVKFDDNNITLEEAMKQVLDEINKRAFELVMI